MALMSGIYWSAIMANWKKTNKMGEILLPFMRSWGIILTCFLSVTLTVLFLTILTEPIYESTAVLSIREGHELNGQLFGFSNALYQKYLIKNQVAILESRNLAVQIIQKLNHLDAKDTLFLFGNKADTTGIPLRERIFGLIRKKNNRNRELTFSDIVNHFEKMTKVTYARDTDIIELKGKSASPEEAAFLVNTWLSEYQLFSHSDTRNEVMQTKKFLDDKVKEIEEKLESSEESLKNFQKRNKVASLTEETEQLVLQLSTIESVYNQTKTELQSVENKLAHLKKGLEETKKNLVEDMSKLSNPVLRQLQETRADLVVRKAAFESQLHGAGLTTANNYKLREMEDRLQGITEQIIEETKKLVKSDLYRINPLDHSEVLITQILELETQQISLYAKLESEETIIDEYSERLETLPDKSQQLARLERDVQVNSKLYMMLKEKYEETRIREASQLSFIRVVDHAHPPSKPIWPNIFLNLMLGCFFGFLLGMGIAFGREYLENAIRSEEEIEELGLKVIGRIPMVKHDKIRSSRREKDMELLRAKHIYPYLITQHSGYSSIAESFRAIRTSIYLINRQKQCKTILVTSAGPGEGKSTTTANIAITMAKKGVKTLLIDSDLRRPVLDILFTGSQRKVGLTHYLTGKNGWRDIIRETSLKNLYIAPAGFGVKNAAEVLSSRQMKDFIREARQVFDIILLDSPPLLPVTDATVLSAFVDGLIFVIKAGKTDKEEVRHALDLLSSVGVTLIGAVITGLRQSEIYGYKDNYSSYMEEMEPKQV